MLTAGTAVTSLIKQFEGSTTSGVHKAVTGFGTGVFAVKVCLLP